MPESIRDYKVLFIANLVVVFTIGLLGNILILLAMRLPSRTHSCSVLP